MYIKKYQDQWKEDTALIPEKNISHVTHRGVPIKGRIDLIERLPDQRIRVVDFKTGNMNNHIRRNQKLKVQTSYDEKGGDYWRQVVFYKILLEALGDSNLHMDIGQMSFVEPDKYGEFYKKDYLIDLGQYEIVSDQIVEVYEKLKNHVFDIDCGRKECEWCQFVNNDFVLPETQENEDKEREPEPLDYSYEGQMEIDF
jgi:DNA helicase-2/ATP-dependent DNA helicase PcrA